MATKYVIVHRRSGSLTVFTAFVFTMVACVIADHPWLALFITLTVLILGALVVGAGRRSIR